jgi:signal transduction histidine kinase
MDFNTWLYVGIGIAIGWGSSKLFNQPSQIAPVVPKVPENEVVQNTDSLLQQVKQTQTAYLMAREMCQFKAGFLARITHELRSPLNGLIGLHQLILSDLCESPLEEREFITQAHERALKLVKLIDDILYVARAEQGTNKLDIQPRQIGEILQEVENLTYLLAANRNFPLRVTLPDSEIYALVDSRWFRQVLVNLVDNTISQMEAGSLYISCGIEHDSNLVLIWLDVPSHAVIWNEPIKLMENSAEFSPKNAVLSPGMRLMLNHTLLDLMGGKLEMLTAPTIKDVTQQMTRLQVSIPSATASK